MTWETFRNAPSRTVTITPNLEAEERFIRELTTAARNARVALTSQREKREAQAMAKTTQFRVEDKTVRFGKFPVGEFIVYQGDESKYPILQIEEEIDGFYILAGADRKFIRPVVTVDATFQELWASE